MTSDIDATGSQVIARAAKILRALESHPKGLSISSLARETDLPRTTVHRLVSSLEAEQLLLNSDEGLQLGPALVRLAASAHTDIIMLSRPFLEKLSKRTRETVDLCVHRGIHAISVSQCASDQELRVISAVGTAFPSHCTAHGKALLSSLTDETILSLLGQRPDVRTDYTLKTIREILADIHLVRQRHYAIDREEHARGVCGIGVSVNCGLSENYAISIAVPAIRFDEKFELVLSAIIQCKAEIEDIVNNKK